MIITNLFFAILLVSVSAKPFNPFDPFGIIETVARVSFGVMENVAEASFGVMEDVVNGRSPDQVVDRVLDTPGKMVEGFLDDLSVGGPSGIIVLHGLGSVGPLGPECKLLSGPALGMSLRKNKITCPNAPNRPPSEIILPAIIGDMSKMFAI